MATCCDCNCATALCTVAEQPLIRSVDGSNCVHFGLAFTDTDCIDLSIDGTGNLIATPIISPDAGNSLGCRANGLYTPSTSVSAWPCNSVTSRSDGLYVEGRGGRKINYFEDYTLGYTLNPGDVSVNLTYHVNTASLSTALRLYNASPLSAGWSTVNVVNPSDCSIAHMFYNLQTSDVWASGLAGTATPWTLAFRAAVYDPISTNIIQLGPGQKFVGANGDEQGNGVHDTDRIQSIPAAYDGDWKIAGLMEVLQVGDGPVTFQNIGLLFMSGLVIVDY